MGAADRTVHHLRLRAPTAQAAVHAAHRLEDALRCASLPDAGERLLLVRRLHLGRLPEGLSPQSLSLLIERRVAAVGGEWVHGEDEARAAHSDTVFFTNRLEAAQAALCRRAQGRSLDGWFWPLALPGVAVHAPAPAFLAQLFDGVLRWPEASAALAVLIDGAQATGQGVWWDAHLPPLWRERLAPAARRAQACGGPGGPRGESSPAPSSAGGMQPAGPDAPTQPLEPPHAGVWPPTAQGNGPAAPENGPQPDAAGPGPQAYAQTPRAAVQPASTTTFASVAAPAPAPQPGDPGAPPSWGTARHMRPARGPLPTADVHPLPASDPWADAVVTGAGGLLFLWPVLERLGLAAWDARHPEAWLAPRVLGLALRRLRVPASDPVWALCASLPRPPEPPPAPDEQAALWLRACCRHLRREPRFGLAHLVVRPARLRWSATHIDLHFRPRDADLRVRRAGLDTDPGWVDALQRVVGFHYDREGPGA